VYHPAEQPFWNLAQLVSASAGFFFDTVSGNVIVSLADTSISAAVRSSLHSQLAGLVRESSARHPGAGVVVRKVLYSYLQLRKWRDQLEGVLDMSGVYWLDLDEVRNRVVFGIDEQADRAAIKRSILNAHVPEGAVALESGAGPLQLYETLDDRIRPIEGGIKIQHYDPGPSEVYDCTLGALALWQGKRAFLTASHCSSNPFFVDSTKQYQNRYPITHQDSLAISSIGQEVADTVNACPKHSHATWCSYTDAAVYQFTGDTANWVLGRVALPSLGCSPGPCGVVQIDSTHPNWAIDSTHNVTVVGDLVSVIGEKSGWNQGFVQKTCVDTYVSQVAELLCQEATDFVADSGDSGGPILLHIDNPSQDTSVTLGGIFVGKSQKYSVYTPWNNISAKYTPIWVSEQP